MLDYYNIIATNPNICHCGGCDLCAKKDKLVYLLKNYHIFIITRSYSLMREYERNLMENFKEVFEACAFALPPIHLDLNYKSEYNLYMDFYYAD